MKLRLTDIAIKRLLPPETGQVTYWDESTPGFGIRLSQKSRSFVVMYGEKRQLKTLGRYPDLALSDARKKARGFLASAKEIPPLSAPSPISFGDAKFRFLADSARRNKERTVKDYQWLLDRHFSFTGYLNQIDRDQVTKALSALANTPSLQQHAFVAIRAMMNWCIDAGLIESSPVPRIRQKTTSRDRILTDDELAAVFRRAQAYPRPYGQMVQLLVLTGQRRGEVVALRRSWIVDDVITFPAELTKNSRVHRLPLTPMVASLINAMPELPDLLFPSRNNPEKPFSGWSKTKARFDAELPFSDYTLHDLRRTFSSNLARMSVPIHVTEKLLNHTSGTISGVAAVYNRHSYQAEMREALLKYEAFLESIVSPM